MKKHTDWSCSQYPRVGEEFSFHGLRIVVDQRAEKDGGTCSDCFYYTRIRELGLRIDCDNDRVPGCEGLLFKEAEILNDEEFKVWQVTRRMGLSDDET